jgi:hypothetical protein
MRYDNNVARFDRCLFSHPKRKFGCRWEPALDIFHESRTFCGANLSLNEFDHPEENRTYLKGYPPN